VSYNSFLSAAETTVTEKSIEPDPLLFTFQKKTNNVFMYNLRNWTDEPFGDTAIGYKVLTY